MKRSGREKPSSAADEPMVVAAHRALMAGRLQRFALCWLATTFAWCAVLHAEGRAPLGVALAVPAGQAVLLLAAAAVCRTDPTAPHILPVLVAVSTGLGLSSTMLFAIARGSGDALAFVLLTLYLACALFFAWGWRPQTTVWLATVAGWIAAMPFLVFRLPAIELATAIVIGSVMALALAEGAARTFRLARVHRAAEENTRRALEASRDAAEAAIRAKDQFLATLSHELRTPLSAILTWTELMRRRAVDPEQEAHALEVVERNARHQARLIEDLLDVSRIAYGKLVLAPKRLDLGRVVRAVVDGVRATAEAKRVHLGVDATADDVPVRADPLRLQQVIENLVSNAIKFTPEGGRVVVGVARCGGWGEVTVRDTGIGMRPDVLARVFERFHQADSSMARRHGGLGLGLAIVRHLVELHGGNVEAASAGESLGSTFTVRLPLDRGDAPAVAPTRVAAGERFPTLAGLRVVVVDDERDTREVFTTLLATCGAEVAPASSADEALRCLEDAPADVLLADLAMPDQDGFALIRRIRAREHASGTHLRAIAVTALAGVEDRRRAMAAGYDVHLAKPVEPLSVVAAVAAVRGDPSAV